MFYLNKMYLERIATDRTKGVKLVLLESSAAQRHPEMQHDIFMRCNQHSEGGIICTVFSPCFANAMALMIINNPESLFSHVALHFREEELYSID